MGLAALLSTTAFAHSSSFGPTKLRALPSDPNEIWAVAEGWGVLYSNTGGTDWTWLCEESVGTTTVYDVLPWEPGVALVATTTGVVRVGPECAATPLTGLPAGFVLVLERWGEQAIAGWIGDGTGGLYACDGSACVATEVVGEYYFPKSLLADGDTLWATLVRTDTLGAQLLQMKDSTVLVAQDYPNGDTDPRLVYASGDTVHLWVRPRSDATVPDYRISEDAGGTFRSTFSTGFYTDPAPGVVVRDAGQTVILGSYFGARTWRSENGGESFSEVSADAPAVKCGIDLDGRTLICADHLADGFSVAVSTDGLSFDPIACFEDVLPAECAAETCTESLAAWTSAAAYGGGQCDAAVDTGGSDEPEPCGCQEGTAIGLLFPLVAWLRRGREP